MELIEIGGHTIAPGLLKDGAIIDIGCRGFYFCTDSVFTDKRIYAIDVDPEVFESAPKIYPNIKMMNIGIWDKEGETTFYRNGEGTCIKPVWEEHKHLYFKCKTITMAQLYETTGKDIDLLKLDCEGAEYIIFGDTFEPIPKQITVEFHFHCVPDIHTKHIDAILKRLGKHYTPFNLKWEPKHGAGFNYWDVLFIRKDQL